MVNFFQSIKIIEGDSLFSSEEKVKKEMCYEYSEDNVKSNIVRFKDKQIGAGKRGPFYNGSQPWVFDLENEGLFRNAVWQGYLDASRTFVKTKHTQDCRNAFNNLAVSIQRYFKGLDSFRHSDWCNAFIKDIQKYNEYEARYGQAQKVVNMAFKYLYCCEGSDKYRDKFEYCHMPLDQFTLAWLFSEGGKFYMGWSYFTEDSYIEAQNEIKEILGDNIIGKEFVIWEEMQNQYVNLEKKYYSI
jgi:hypothetical protein